MKKEKLIINGNAFYEIDLECFEKKKKDTKHFPDKKAKTVSIATATVVITSASFITASTICSS